MIRCADCGVAWTADTDADGWMLPRGLDDSRPALCPTHAAVSMPHDEAFAAEHTPEDGAAPCGHKPGEDLCPACEIVPTGGDLCDGCDPGPLLAEIARARVSP